MQHASVTCLYTTVKNISGAERFFGYIGPRGTRLEAGEVYTVPGDLLSALTAGWTRQKFLALERSLDQHQSLSIISTPAVFLFDPVADRTRQLGLQNGLLGLIDPCYESSGSSDFSNA